MQKIQKRMLEQGEFTKKFHKDILKFTFELYTTQIYTTQNCRMWNDYIMNDIV